MTLSGMLLTWFGGLCDFLLFGQIAKQMSRRYGAIAEATCVFVPCLAVLGMIIWVQP